MCFLVACFFMTAIYQLDCNIPSLVHGEISFSFFGGIILFWFFMVLDELSLYLHTEANVRS